MKAVILSRTGDSGVLQVIEIPNPTLGPNDCLIRIKYAGVNYADILSRQGLYNWQGKRPYILGLESSGVIEQVGASASKFKVGDRVVVGSKNGNYAELTARHENDIFPAPEFLDFKQLACLCGNWTPAWVALFELARVRPGESALIHSGAGGVGTAAIQLAKAHGMIVYATARSQEKKDYIASLGATPLDYKNFHEILKGERAPNFILESVGGNVHKRSLKILSPLGRMVSIGATSIKINKLSPLSWYKAWKDFPRIRRRDLDNQSYATLHIGFLLENHRNLVMPIWNRMIKFMREHDLKPVLQTDCVHPMSQIARVHELIDKRQNIGKLLIDPAK